MSSVEDRIQAILQFNPTPGDLTRATNDARSQLAASLPLGVLRAYGRTVEVPGEGLTLTTVDRVVEVWTGGRRAVERPTKEIAERTVVPHRAVWTRENDLLTVHFGSGGVAPRAVLVSVDDLTPLPNDYPLLEVIATRASLSLIDEKIAEVRSVAAPLDTFTTGGDDGLPALALDYADYDTYFDLEDPEQEQGALAGLQTKIEEYGAGVAGASSTAAMAQQKTRMLFYEKQRVEQRYLRGVKTLTNLKAQDAPITPVFHAY